MTLLRPLITWYNSSLVPGGLTAGDYCSIKTGELFSIVKILAVDGTVIHLKTYREMFPVRPKQIDPPLLSKDGYDTRICYIPLSRSKFGAWRPELVTWFPVSLQESTCVREWEKAHGEVWS